MLVATTSPYSLITLNISEWRKGTKENVECSGNGLCNRDVGVCNCLDGFASSSDTKKNKFGEYGERGDCAFRHGGTKDEKWFTSLDTDNSGEVDVEECTAARRPTCHAIDVHWLMCAQVKIAGRRRRGYCGRSAPCRPKVHGQVRLPREIPREYRGIFEPDRRWTGAPRRLRPGLHATQ